MSTHLHQLLRCLCWNTEWNYAVFWKLKHRARMVLTWEDGYYNNHYCDPSENKIFSESLDGLQDGHLAHDSLGLAVAKMGNHVYTLGEGIVGQVAISGNHQWICSGENVMKSFSSLDLCGGWQSQFEAGIKTIVVAAVAPHGVIQFGSLNKVNENLQFLAHIRDMFSSLQDPAFHMQTPTQFSLQHVVQMPDISSRTLSPDVQDYLIDKGGNENGIPEAIGCAGRVQTVPALIKQSTSLLNNPNYENNSSKILNPEASDSNRICQPSKSCVTESSTLYDSKRTGEKSGVQFNCPSVDYKLVASDSLAKPNVYNNTVILPEFNCLESSGELNSSFMFSSGNELHEALGPEFMKQCYYSFPGEVEKPEDSSTSQIPEAIENSMLTSDFGTDHLLEAVVANFCRRDAIKSRTSFSNSDSMLTTERMPEPSISPSHTIGSSFYSMSNSSFLGESSQNCLNSSDSCSIRSSAGKPNKKRARPGENSRPRPRDRQLIQDRIKELRELVPNGSKCSIDSLLERTIKHMAYMQNVTEHSDKLSECAKAKGCSEMGVLGSSQDKGSSWAVEVGGHMKICPILVENLNMNGQMLIEMLCEDCDHFLEITEAIRSLGLTILKGITDGREDKTWMRFVVEGQSNRNLHRMDVLWSLVQILQSKTTV